MHRVVTSMTVGRSTAGDINCSEGEYKFGKGIVIPKINARPVDFFALSSILNITPECYDKMYVVHGLVSCITVQKTKCTWVAYKCKLCAHEQAIRQKEYPTKPLHCRIQCNCKRSFKELRSSSYSKIEYIEMIRLHEVGMHNFDKSIYIDIEVRRDLVDTFFPGLEITVVGVLKMKPITLEKPKLKNYYLQAVCLVNNEPLRSNQKDNSIIQTITMEHNYIGLLVQSLAPEICGYEMVKLAVLLSLFGGSRSHLGDKGELNVLLIADPGLGKSKLLKNAASVSERGRFVSVNEKTNFMPTCQSTRNSIDTGSLMISQTGHCCIDDLEKLSRNQELLIHTMQTKSSSSRVHNKTFKILAKPSIIAAVNPAGVHYDPSKLLRENVQLSPSFLSLFHLVFLICDEADKDQDNTLTEHVKALHSGMKHVLSIPTKYNLELKPNNCNVHSEKSCFDNQQKNNSNEHLDLLPGVLLNKYIGYARNNINPLLTEEATSKIKEYYMGLRRGKNKEELFSITTRQLEGLILLTKARARIELSFRVTEQHVDDVINLVRLSRTSTADLVNAKQYGSFLGTSSGSKIKKCIQMLQARCNALSRTTFELEELKDIALHAGLKSDVADVIDVINMQGYLLKKGPNLYEFINNV
ncbi:DNA replication licensing factor REC [Eupeodes corollae]|uniref:DNA replication licensing factor REC n=1 Tax=Eupeodes corollae TaxID=290404 RepID=UPI0024917DF7|nr:DNA replication licensing factor REC [Eupeodes corollae]